MSNEIAYCGQDNSVGGFFLPKCTVHITINNILHINGVHKQRHVSSSPIDFVSFLIIPRFCYSSISTCDSSGCQSYMIFFLFVDPYPYGNFYIWIVSSFNYLVKVEEYVQQRRGHCLRPSRIQKLRMESPDCTTVLNFLDSYRNPQSPRRCHQGYFKAILAMADHSFS